MRSLTLTFLLLYISGCAEKKSEPEAIPVLPPVSGIKAQFLDVPQFSLSSSEWIVVPDDQLDSFARLVVPAKPCLQQIDTKRSYHVVNVILEHKDGTSTTLIVRWTGHNPAAVSLDGSKYYYGGMDEFPDGATRIMRILAKHEFDARASLEN
jgi:hypothetical protein